MPIRLVPLVFLGAFLVSAIPHSSSAQQAGRAPGDRQEPAAQSEQVRQGVAHFERAFYDHIPHKRNAEASAEFDLAVAAFERELAVRPSSVVAHSYLARIYNVRKQYRKAAEHYDRLMELEPLDVDVCVQAALAYAEAGDVTQARARLSAATGRTSDPAVLARLAEYNSKLDSIR
jgi:tetratricopeptide (TPR) repeat protein